MTTGPTADDLRAALGDEFPTLSDDEQRLAAAVYRLLARGEPVPIGAAAQKARLDETFVRSTLDEWPGVYRDDSGALVGFWGLAIAEMPHRLEIDGNAVFTWCAWDPFFIVPLLATTGRVTSTCPVTGREVRLTIEGDSVTTLDPRGAVLSFLSPSGHWGPEVVETFCHYVLLFASPQAGESWVADHPGTFLISIDEAAELGRAVAKGRFGAG